MQGANGAAPTQITPAPSYETTVMVPIKLTVTPQAAP